MYWAFISMGTHGYEYISIKYAIVFCVQCLAVDSEKRVWEYKLTKSFVNESDISECASFKNRELSLLMRAKS